MRLCRKKTSCIDTRWVIYVDNKLLLLFTRQVIALTSFLEQEIEKNYCGPREFEKLNLRYRGPSLFTYID